MHRLACSALVLAAALAGTPALAAAAAATPTTEIVQQRLGDGRILLTDHPSPELVTERTWRMPAEDPVAARERARQVRIDAERVSARIDRLLADDRRVALENERLQAAAAERDAQRSRDAVVGAGDEGVWAGGVYFAPARRAALRRGFGIDDRRRHGDHAPGVRPSPHGHDGWREPR